MRRNISAISGLKENNNDNLNRSKSPKRVINGVRLYNFSQIQSYRYINKPYLNDVKKENIKQKLDLQKTTEARVARRFKKNDLYVPFNHNPFSYQRLSKSLANIALDKNGKNQTSDEKNETSKNNTSKNIIDQIVNLKKKKLDKQVESKQLSKAQFRAKEFSDLVQKQVKNSKIVRPIERRQMNKSMVELTPKPQVSPEPQLEKLEGEMQFQDIIEMREERYQQHKNKQKELNIFTLLHDRQFFNKKFVILDKFFFSFNSIFDKFQKYKIQFYRDMSRDSRANVSKKPQGKVEFMQSIGQAEIRFEDLINVASGRFTPQEVYSQLNLEKATDNSNYSELDQDEIRYQQNTSNKAISANKYDHSIKEVQEFLKLTLNKKEEAFLKMNILRKEGMRDQLQAVKRLINISIYDKKIHKSLRENVTKDLHRYVNQNYKYPKSGSEREALVRGHKEEKGKNELIKLKQLVESFQIVNQHDSKVNQLINKRI